MSKTPVPLQTLVELVEVKVIVGKGFTDNWTLLLEVNVVEQLGEPPVLIEVTVNILPSLAETKPTVKLVDPEANDAVKALPPFML